MAILKWREYCGRQMRRRVQGEGSHPQPSGNRPAVSLKNDNGLKPPSGLCYMQMRLVLVGWPSMELLVIGPLRLGGEGWAWMTAERESWEGE